MSSKYFDCLNKLMLPQLEALEIELSDSQINYFGRLLEAMLSDPLYPSVSKIFAVEEIIEKHFLDSLAPLTFNFDFWKKASFIDLGTGGGFPCIPLAIALPSSTFLAVDARLKSVEFVARMGKEIGLQNLLVKHSRIEDIGRDNDFREKFDVVVCRALSSVRVLVEYTMPLAKTGGNVLLYKGPRLQEELEDADTAFSSFAIQEHDICELSIEPPSLPFVRNYLLIKKNNPVPSTFPRKRGVPSSRPL